MDQPESAPAPRPGAKDRVVRLTTPHIIFSLIVAVALIGAFAGGVQYGKGSHRQTARTAAATGRGGQFGSRRGVFGTVTAVSATSISVQNNRTGTMQTYAITASTVITDNQQTVQPSAIAVGNTVLITAASSAGTGTDAATIVVNPTAGPGAAAPSSNQINTQTN